MSFKRTHEGIKIGVFGIGSVSAALIGLSYWIVSVLIRPDEPMSIRIMYRYDDTDYLPFIYALAQLKVHNFVTLEGGGLLPFPLLMDVPHAAMIALLGDWGFAAADTVIMLIWFVLFFSIARVFTTGRAAVLSGLVMLVASGPWSWLGFHIFEFWGFRYTRPFIAGLFMLALVLTTRTIAASFLEGRARPGVYGIHGLLLGGSAEGDMHLAIIGCFVTSALYLSFLVSRQSKGLWQRATSLTAAGFGLGVLPMAVQLAVAEHGDYTARLGMFPIDRLHPPFYFDINDAIKLAAVFGLWGVVYILTRRYAASRVRDVNLLLATILGYFVFSVLALPLSAGLIGRGFLLYEFHDRSTKFTHLGFVVGISLLSVLSYHAWLSTHERPERRVPVTVQLLGGLALVGVAIIGIGKSAIMAAERATTTFQPRVLDSKLESRFWQFGWPVLPNYRSDFTKLAGELGHPQYDSYRVLGTFDQQISMWWLAFRKGYLFVPDPFVSSMSDDFIEKRTLEMLKLAGASLQFFDQKLNEPYFIERFFSHDEWQASAAYTYRKLGDYSLTQIDQIRTATVLDSWSVLVPRSEQERLLAAFSQTGAPTRPPELIILPKGAGYEELRGPGAPYRLTYENTTFRVWTTPLRDD